MARRIATKHKVHRAVRKVSKRGPSTLAKAGAFLALPLPDAELAVAALANPNSGIKFVLGIAKKAGKRLSEVQSVIFEKARWTADAAKGWLKGHGFAETAKDEGATFWRFRQQAPGKYKEFRTIVPGAQRNPYPEESGGITRFTPGEGGGRLLRFVVTVDDKVVFQSNDHHEAQLKRDMRRMDGEDAVLWHRGRIGPSYLKSVEYRAENPDVADSIRSYDEHLGITTRAEFQGATPDEQAAAMTVMDQCENPHGEGSHYAVVDGVRVGLGTDNIIVFSTDWDHLWKLAAKGDSRLAKRSGGPETMGHTDLFYVGRDVKKYPAYEEENPWSLRDKLSHAVTEYDRKQEGKHGYNRYALGHYLGAVDRVVGEVNKGYSVRSAITNNFTGQVANHLLRVVKESPLNREESIGPMAREERNPGDLGQDAFDAGKEFRLSGAYYETGVADARVARYGFTKWWSNLPPSTKGKSRLLSAWMEGWAAGKRVERRQNPEADAVGLFQEFHGRDPETIKTVVSEEHEHEWMTELGPLEGLVVETVSGLKATINFEGADMPSLASSEDGKQLFIVGDVELDLGKLKMSGPKWERDLMTIGTLTQFTYIARKDHIDKRKTSYFHNTAEAGGPTKPMLLYETRNRRLLISGGNYKTTSRGVEN